MALLQCFAHFQKQGQDKSVADQVKTRVLLMASTSPFMSNFVSATELVMEVTHIVIKTCLEKLYIL